MDMSLLPKIRVNFESRADVIFVCEYDGAIILFLFLLFASLVISRISHNTLQREFNCKEDSRLAIRSSSWKQNQI